MTKCHIIITIVVKSQHNVITILSLINNINLWDNISSSLICYCLRPNMDLIILMGKPRHLDNDFTAAITFWADNKVFNLNQSSKSQLITGKELLCFERVTLLTLDKQQNQRGGVSRKNRANKVQTSEWRRKNVLSKSWKDGMCNQWIIQRLKSVNSRPCLIITALAQS